MAWPWSHAPGSAVRRALMRWNLSASKKFPVRPVVNTSLYGQRGDQALIFQLGLFFLARWTPDTPCWPTQNERTTDVHCRTAGFICLTSFSTSKSVTKGLFVLPHCPSRSLQTGQAMDTRDRASVAFHAAEGPGRSELWGPRSAKGVERTGDGWRVSVLF